MSIDTSATENARPAPPRRAAPRPRATHHLVILVFCCMAIIGAFALGINRTDHIAIPFGIQMPSVCQFRNVTGLDCPGCGLTRAFVSIAHGRIVEAVSYNGASLLVFAFVLLQIPYRITQIWRLRTGREELCWPRTTNVVLIVVAGAMFVQWGVKLARHFWA